MIKTLIAKMFTTGQMIPARRVSIFSTSRRKIIHTLINLNIYLVGKDVQQTNTFQMYWQNTLGKWLSNLTFHISCISSLSVHLPLLCLLPFSCSEKQLKKTIFIQFRYNLKCVFKSHFACFCIWNNPIIVHDTDTTQPNPMILIEGGCTCPEGGGLLLVRLTRMFICRPAGRASPGDSPELLFLTRREPEAFPE